MFVKRFVRSILHTFSPDGFRERAMRRIVFRLHARTSNFFFMQIGSNDGRANDPLYRFVRTCGWRGVLVEPVPRLFARLQETYRGIPGLFFEHSAIAAQTGRRMFYSLAPSNDRGNPVWYDQIGSFQKDVIVKHRDRIPHFDERFQSEEISCLSFADLLEKYQISHIDLLHMDTEGYDFELIKCIPFERFVPTILWFEHKHLSSEDTRACFALLKKHGYTWIRTHEDTFAYQPHLVQ